MKNNFLDTFTRFLKLLKVPVTQTSALEYLERHPDEGSMLAYSDALNHFKIENAAIRIKQEDLINIPTPFIAFSQKHGGTFSVVKNLSDNTIEWFDTQKGWVKEKLEEFTKTWSGIVLLAEKVENSGEKNYASKRQDEILRIIRIPISISLLVFILLYFIQKTHLIGINSYILIGLKAIGMVISSILLAKSIDKANSLTNKLCNAGSKISCQSILDSPAAKITPWFSWSDAGFIYFYGSFLAMLFTFSYATQLNTYWTVQLVFSSLALLFSSYSLYYQGIKAKIWCTLCLGVISIFFFEAVLTFSFTSFITNSIEIQGVFNIAIGFLFPTAFLGLYKSTAIRAQESKSLKKELTKLKSNPQIFQALMAGQREMPEIPADLPVISIGNINANQTITMVSNPLCTPCAHMHVRIEKILQENENLKCQIIFLSNTDKQDAGGQFVRKLFNLPDELKAIALHEWFGRNDKNFDRWNKGYIEYESGDSNNYIQALHLNWANEAEVNSTPSLFFEDRKLSSSFKLEDLNFVALKEATNSKMVLQNN